MVPSQRGPEKSLGQMHSYSPSEVSKQCALFLHGLGLHGDTAENDRKQPCLEFRRTRNLIYLGFLKVQLIITQINRTRVL